MVIEHIAVRIAGKIVLEKLRSLTAASRMDEAVEKSKEDLVLSLADRVSALELENAGQREQFLPLFHRLFTEAVYAASAERRLMLVSAITGVVKYEDGAEIQSRIARAVLVLEVSDVAVLRAWADEAPSTSPFRDFRVAKAELEQRFGEAFSVKALEAALCIHHSASGRLVTPLGHSVLKYLTG